VCSTAKFDEVEEAHQRAADLLTPVVKRRDLSLVPMAYALPFKAKVLFQAGEVDPEIRTVG
jgi:hypothetical protein